MPPPPLAGNLYSFEPVQALLANTLRGVVTSHDMPGFGLTERCAHLRPPDQLPLSQPSVEA